ncbi:MAG TPA: thioredoxin family protein [Methylomirabilota bacterium]|nr:thioredoxin family protein [Methylomirabilota bacterium]
MTVISCTGAGRGSRVVTPQRFASGMTFDEYLAFIGTPENLAREAGWWLGPERMDWSAILRRWHDGLQLRDGQVAAIRWLAAQPRGPAKILVISEEWSSDCRRAVPMLSRLAEAGGLELRIFTRDGARVGREPRANPTDSPNADLMNEFLREENGQTYQSIPVAVFYTDTLEYLYHFTERPAIYHPGRLADAMRAPRPGETREETWERFMRDWRAMQQSPFFAVWAFAGIDEMLSALYERMIGSLR